MPPIDVMLAPVDVRLPDLAQSLDRVDRPGQRLFDGRTHEDPLSGDLQLLAGRVCGIADSAMTWSGTYRGDNAERMLHGRPLRLPPR